MPLKISVITPSFNTASTIKEAIESVLAQGYSHYEHIIVDGASTDGTVDILKSYPHLKWVSEPDRGQAHAMNKGFAMAEGEIIVFLNADDYFMPEAFSKVAPLFESGHVFVVGKVLVKLDHGEFINDPKVTLAEMLMHWKADAFPNNPVGYFYRREVQDACPFNEDNESMMDLEFLYEAASRYAFFKIDDVLGVYRAFANTKTMKTQQEIEYWRPETFAFIKPFVAKMPEDYQRHFHRAWELGLQERRQIRIREHSQQGKLDPMLQNGKVISLPEPIVGPDQVIKFNRHVVDGDVVVLVHQYGKVGSTSIYTLFLKDFPFIPVYHQHCLFCTERRADLFSDYLRRFNVPHLKTALALTYVLPQCKNRLKWKIISLVREPVSWSLSALFENLERDFPWCFYEGQLDFQAVTEQAYRGLSNLQWYQEWFDNEIKKHFGIDVYAQSFDKKKGYAIYEQGNVSILIMKIDRLNDAFSEAMTEFLGLDDLHLPVSNKGVDRGIGAYYGQLKSAVKLDDSILHDIYNHKSVTHFYTQEEIQGFKDCWVKKTDKTGHKPSELVVFTSIAPKNIEAQQLTVGTWLSQGLRVISVNNAAELKQLQPHFPGVEFSIAKRDAAAEYGLPLIYLEDIMAAANESKAEVIGLINSDIKLGPLDFDRIAETARNNLVYCHRFEIGSFEDTDGTLFEDGLDVFFWNTKHTRFLSHPGFCLGRAWWDFLLPISAMLHKIPLVRLESAPVFHVSHPQSIYGNEWYKLGNMICRYVRSHKEIDNVDPSFWCNPCVRRIVESPNIDFSNDFLVAFAFEVLRLLQIYSGTLDCG